MKIQLLLRVTLVSFFLMTSLYAQDSKEWRKLKKYEGTVQFGHDYHMFQPQLGASVAINPDNRLGFKIGEISSEDDYQFSAAIQFKHFEGLSFYIAPEIYYLNYKEGDWFDLFDPEDYDRSTSIGAKVSIGNQGQWKDFTIGIDWIGLGYDLIYFDRVGSEKKFTFTIVNAYVGLSF